MGMALTRRRQPRKAVGTQILCKRTRSRERTFLLIFDLGRIARRVIAARGHVYVSASVYTSRGNWLSTLPGATTVRRATRQLGMWVTYRNRALSNPIPLYRTPPPSTAFHHRDRVPHFLPACLPPFFSPFFGPCYAFRSSPFCSSLLLLPLLLSPSPAMDNPGVSEGACGFDVVI